MANVTEVIKFLETFERWSGLKINSEKTQVVVFRIECCEPPLVSTLKLLGITFNNLLWNMDSIYEKGLDGDRRVTNNWMYTSL